MKTILAIYTGLILTALTAVADSTAQRQKHYNLKGGVAIQGYDPVAYFSGAAAKGNSKYSHTTKGVTYHFSSAGNLAKFKANPSKYEPQFGGWCAYAFAKKAGKVKINPKSYKVIKGKLYLFYNSAPWGNTLKKWNKGSESSQLSIARAEWKKFIP